MLPKKHRLTYRESEALLKNSFSLASPFFTLKVRYGLESTKCSVAVPKRVAKKAVERNRIRRRIYAACREVFEEFPLGVHILLFARKGVEGTSLEEIKAEIRRCVGEIAKKRKKKRA